MKRSGAYFEYEEARNKDLMRAYGEVRAAHPDMQLPQVYKEVVSKPSERFWVSEERAAIVIANMFKGDQLEKMLPQKREMYMEIYARVAELRKRNPKRSIYDLTFDVVNSRAPRFYLTPGSAKVIIHKIKHKWYQERKRKLRFSCM